MADEKVESKPDTDETELRAELEADGELLDDTGKPLPWNHPKRVRRIYKEAKDGRKVTSTLKELGVKAGDLPAIIGEYNEFKVAYEEWKEKKEAGKTTEDEDDEAKAARQQAEKFKKVLEQMGVQFKDESKAKTDPAEERKTQILTRSYDRMSDLVEEAGYDLDKMETKERNKFLKHVDFLVGQEIEDDEDALKAFMGGSLRPIEKYTKKVLESLSVTKSLVKSSGIKSLPPRATSSPGSAVKSKVDETTPETVKDATDQMVEALKANKARRHTEE